MKRSVFFLGIILLLVSIAACSEEPPSIRVSNERATKANVQIKTTSNTFNQNDIKGGTTTSFMDIPEGKIEVTAVIQSEDVSPATTFNASNDNNYTVIVVNSTPPVLKVNSSEK